jgi:3',5'-cyclic AMP phosphodiesterase CpdA
MKPRFRQPARILAAAAAVLLLAGDARAGSFAVCGDSRDDRRGIFPRILEEVARSPAAFLLHTGDLENGGGEKRWRAFRERIAGFPKPVRPVVGNHELRGASREAFARFFGLPAARYSFDHEDAHFAILDNADGRMEGDGIGWLDRDLAAHPKGRNGIRHLVVAMHVPPRTERIEPHGVPVDYAGTSGRLLEVLKRHGVSLVLCGHEHTQFVENWEGIRVIVTGGAGARMVPFSRFGWYEIDLAPETPREIFHAIEP